MWSQGRTHFKQRRDWCIDRLLVFVATSGLLTLNLSFVSPQHGKVFLSPVIWLSLPRPTTQLGKAQLHEQVPPVVLESSTGAARLKNGGASVNADFTGQLNGLFVFLAVLGSPLHAHVVRLSATLCGSLTSSIARVGTTPEVGVFR